MDATALPRGDAVRIRSENPEAIHAPTADPDLVEPAADPAGAEPTTDPDARLMVLAAQGDRRAFRALFEKYQRPLANFIYRIVLDEAEAEDLTQEVFLRVHAASARYRPQARFSTWLYRIATNAALNARKARLRRPTIAFDALGNAGSMSPNAAERPDRCLERKEIARAVERALARLPERQRAAVVLQRFEGLSYQEIADVLAVSTDAVDAMLRRAKVALRDALAPYRPEGA